MPAIAQPEPPAGAIDHQLDQQAVAWSADGWTGFGERLEGTLGANEEEFVTIRVPPGQSLVIVGACDSSCSDVDLWVYGEDDRPLAEDETKDNLPILEVPGRDVRTETLDVEVGMVACAADSCRWGLMVLAGGTSHGRRLEAPQVVPRVVPQVVSEVAKREEAPKPAKRRPATIRRQGELRSGDKSLRSGEYYDEVSFQADAGERISVLLKSDDFSPYLVLRSPSDATFEIAVEGRPSSARAVATLDEPGTWRVLATSVVAEKTGRWELEIRRETGPAADPH